MLLSSWLKMQSHGIHQSFACLAIPKWPLRRFLISYFFIFMSLQVLLWLQTSEGFIMSITKPFILVDSGEWFLYKHVENLSPHLSSSWATIWSIWPCIRFDHGTLCEMMRFQFQPGKPNNVHVIVKSTKMCTNFKMWENIFFASWWHF